MQNRAQRGQKKGCKLRSRLESAVAKIEIADVREIIIDYLLTSRKWIDVFREMCSATCSFRLSEFACSPDSNFHMLRVVLALAQWKLHDQLSYAIKSVIDVLDDKYTVNMSANLVEMYGSMESCKAINHMRDHLIVCMNRPAIELQ